LRQLERTGLVSSFWDTSESGPARRMYSLTKAGDLFLSGWIDVLGKYQAVFQKTIEDLDPGATDDEKEPPRAARG
ncbi:MAG TPA: helix-turn-helix transcriptional regulator, partial [Dehalococcoidia bacterium]